MIKGIFELVINYSDLLCHHCKKSEEILNEHYPDSIRKINIVVPHGDYFLDFRQVSKEKARKKLGIPMDKFVILNFGKQIDYKNTDFLETVFRKLPTRFEEALR